MTGILPVGAFLLEHFFTNSFAMFGAGAFDSKVEFFMGLPYILAIEVVLIWIPLLFHGCYGLYIILGGEARPVRYRYGRNWMYILQRVTGVIAFLFVIYHVYSTRIHGLITGAHVSFASVRESLENPAVFLLYLVGVISSAYHLGNGLFGFCITWGLAVGERTQKVLSVVCGASFLFLSVFGLAALSYFR